MSRLYRLALRAFPARHRRQYAAEMVDAFERQLAVHRHSGSLGAARFAIAACLNVLATGIAERRRHRVMRLGSVFSALDFTLAWRILLRHRGLSIVSVFGMAVGIAICAVAFTVTFVMLDTRLPLPDGDRIVSLVSYDSATSNNEMRLAHDFSAWRGLRSIEHLSIARQVQRNLIVAGRLAEPIAVSQISASAFRVTGVAAFRGRHLLPEDEAPNADDAVVIGYGEWLRRFDGAPDIVGTRIQLGTEHYTIVGVMPDGFGFPTYHGFWVPWRVPDGTYAPRTGPLVTIFGRLAPGATIDSAQAELTAISDRLAGELPATHQHLRGRVVPYVYAYTDMGSPDNIVTMYAIRLAIVLLLVLVCVNVAILVYARTATRQGEIAVRGALGASRLRIVAQLFVEALTLAAVAAIVGVGITMMALPQLEAAFLGIVGGRMPFWMDFSLPVESVIYIVALTLLAAGIVGVAPALKATGRDVHARLQTLSAGSGSRMQMGRVWTTLIAAQVALTVALLPAAMFFTWDGLRIRSGDSGFASREFMTAALASDRALETPGAESDAAFRARYAASIDTLEPRLRAHAAVRDVTFSALNPGEELAMVIDAEGKEPPPDLVDYNIVEGEKRGHLARYNQVATNFLDAFGVPVILGRGFSTSDPGADRIVVNRTLADAVFGGESPLGRRIKYVGRSREAGERTVPMDRWFEIVGVVADFPINQRFPDLRIYHPAAIAQLYPARVSVRVRSADPATFSDALRQISAAVNPHLQVRDITSAQITVAREQGLFRMIGTAVGLVMLSVIVLSGAGIYALMSFTVAKRRREIGIRAALGANRNRLLAGIFSRAIAQLGAGAAIGMVAAFGLEQLLEGEMFQGYGAVILPLVAIVMMAVGLLAALGPARQGLRIQPTEALREE